MFTVVITAKFSDSVFHIPFLTLTAASACVDDFRARGHEAVIVGYLY